MDTVRSHASRLSAAVVCLLCLVELLQAGCGRSSQKNALRAMEPSLRLHLAMVRNYLQNEEYLTVVERADKSTCYIQSNKFPLVGVPAKPISQKIDMEFIERLNEAYWSPWGPGVERVTIGDVLKKTPAGKVGIVHSDSIAQCRAILDCCRLYLEHLGPAFVSEEMAAENNVVPIKDIRQALEEYAR